MADERKGLKFKCTNPDCECKELECVEEGVTLSSTIMSLNEDGDFDYESPSMDGGEINRYQCQYCGFVLKDEDNNNLTEHLEVVEWVKKNCKQD